MPNDLESLQELVDRTIKNEIIDNDFVPAGLYAPVKYILSIGGKRIRPVLALMACELFGGDIQKAVLPAIGLEVFHNFTLLHDDIMDKSKMRRNKPTVHVKWNENTAILSGDAMQIMAYQLIAACNFDKLSDVLQTFNQTALEVCEGQQYDMEFENRKNVTINEYLEMIRLKTSVLLAGSLKIGAIIGDAPLEDTEKIYQFGLNLGMAFQLQDDYLDTFGDSRVFGKNIGGDIKSNKKTFLLISALENAHGKAREDLDYWLSVKEFNKDEKIATIKSIYESLDIAEISHRKMLEYHSNALRHLAEINLPKKKKAPLFYLAKKMLKRHN